jgi:hypothetical protein
MNNTNYITITREELESIKPHLLKAKIIIKEMLAVNVEDYTTTIKGGWLSSDKEVIDKRGYMAAGTSDYTRANGYWYYIETNDRGDSAMYFLELINSTVVYKDIQLDNNAFNYFSILKEEANKV